MTDNEPPTGASPPHGRSRAARWGNRSSLGKLVSGAMALMGEDRSKFSVLVAISFVMGLFEAFLVLIVVQMAVALAGEREHFDLNLGPVAVAEIPLLSGVGAGVLLVVLLIAGLIPVAVLLGRVTARAQHRTRQRLLGAYLRAEWSARATYPEGHFQELLTTYTERADRAVTQLILASLAFCGLTAIVLTAVVSSPVVAVLAIIGIAAVGSALRPVLKRTRGASQAYATLDKAFASRTAEIARMTPEIAVFDVGTTVEREVDHDAAQVAGALQRIRTLNRMGSSLYQYFALLLVILAIGGVSRFASPSGLSTTGGVLLLLMRALSYGHALQAQIQGSHEIAPYLERIEHDLGELVVAEVRRDGERVDRPLPIEFHDVRFSYDQSDPVLRGVSFAVAEGESVAIVGPSGAGKSTLAYLLLQLRQPTGGHITACGVPLGDVSLERWYELIGYVPQDNKLISGTIADNIRFFRPDVTADVIETSARRAHLHEDIMAMPDGYATRVGPGARDLSGGQRQRLGIARALAGAPQLIILDEPTSALDARSERLIVETLSELRRTVSLVIVAHRPATTAICDRVLRVDQGRVVAVDHERSDSAPVAARAGAGDEPD